MVGVHYRCLISEERHIERKDRKYINAGDLPSGGPPARASLLYGAGLSGLKTEFEGSCNPRNPRMSSIRVITGKEPLH